MTLSKFEIRCKKCGSADVEIVGGECIFCGDEFWSLECQACHTMKTNHKDHKPTNESD